MGLSDLLNPEKIIAAAFKVFGGLLAFLLIVQLLLAILCRLSATEVVIVLFLSAALNSAFLFMRGSIGSSQSSR